jgi:lysophospholipase L1-like esterase
MKLHSFKRWIAAMAVLSCCIFPATVMQANVTIPATDSGIAYYGRWNHSAGMAKTGRGATYIKAGFTGTSIAVKLKDQGILWKYSIDESPVQAFKPHDAETILAESLPAGTHQLLLVRDTEGQEGISEFSGLILADGAGTTTPEPPKSRSIEIIGDSITAGLWNMGKGDLPEYENGYMAYGPQLARLLHADWSIIAKSGEGVIHNYADTPSFRVHAKDDYVRTFFSEAKPKWNFIQKPQVVLVAYGTNDFVDKDTKPSLHQFAKAYTKLLHTIRAKNPSAVIICLEPIPAWVGQDVRNTIAGVVTQLQRKGDQQVHFISVNAQGPLLQKQDFIADGTHPTIQGDTKLALYLKDKVADIMGWREGAEEPKVNNHF